MRNEAKRRQRMRTLLTSFNTITPTTLVKAFISLGDAGRRSSKFTTRKCAMRRQIDNGCKRSSQG